MRHAFCTGLFLLSASALVFTALLNGTAQAEEPSGTSPLSNPMTKINYGCERNITLPVVYIDHAGEKASIAIIGIDGKLVPMRQTISGSGVLYVALDEQDSYRWHTKGNQGTLSYLEADHTAEEQILLRNCTAKDQPD